MTIKTEFGINFPPRSLLPILLFQLSVICASQILLLLLTWYLIALDELNL